MKILKFFSFFFIFSIAVYSQSSVDVGSGSSIDLGSGTDLSAGSRSGTFTGTGTFNGGALPVELASFSATISNDKVILNWETATELNCYGFEVERKNPPLHPLQGGEQKDWVKIGFVTGAGSSNSPNNYTFTDLPTGGTRFSYRLKQIDNDGNYQYYDALTVTLPLKQYPELMDNYPNPFNPSTAIKFYIPNISDVSIKIYDMLGKEIAALVNNQTGAGYHIIYWNGKNKNGTQAASGIYLYRLTAVSSTGSETVFVQTKKMNLLK